MKMIIASLLVFIVWNSGSWAQTNYYNTTYTDKIDIPCDPSFIDIDAPTGNVPPFLVPENLPSSSISGFALMQKGVHLYIGNGVYLVNHGNTILEDKYNDPEGYLYDTIPEITNKGRFIVKGSWVHRSSGDGHIRGNKGYVEFNNTKTIQFIRGNQYNDNTVQFNGIELSGVGILSLECDVKSDYITWLNDRELATNSRTYYINNPTHEYVINAQPVHAINRITGFVSSTCHGSLKRDMNKYAGYYFPIGNRGFSQGSSQSHRHTVKPMRFRPIWIEPRALIPNIDSTNSTFPSQNAATVSNIQTYKARLINQRLPNDRWYPNLFSDFSDFGYLIDTETPILVQEPCDISIFYNQVQDRRFSHLAHLQHGESGNGNSWELTPYCLQGTFPTSKLPYPELDAWVTSYHYNDFTTDGFYLAQTGFEIITNENFGDEGIKYSIVGDGLNSTDNEAGGGTKKSNFNPSGKPGSYAIKFPETSRSEKLDIDFQITPNLQITDVTVDGFKLAKELYEIKNGRSLILKGSPEDILASCAEKAFEASIGTSNIGSSGISNQVKVTNTEPLHIPQTDAKKYYKKITIHDPSGNSHYFNATAINSLESDGYNCPNSSGVIPGTTVDMRTTFSTGGVFKFEFEIFNEDEHGDILSTTTSYNGQFIYVP